MRLKTAVFSTFLIALFSGFTGSEKTELAIERVRSLFLSTQNIQTLSYKFYREERINGKMVKNHSEVKMQRLPYKVYIRETFPNDGLEVLYPTTLDDGKALINPNGFPWVNLRLDPEGILMRRNQHHTVMDGGFDYIVSVMEYTFYKHKGKIDGMIEYEGTTIFDNQDCDVISISNPDYRYINHVVSRGESVSSIAAKFRLNEYLILDKNEGLGLSDDLDKGQLLKIPSDYAKLIRIYIDQEKQVPLMMEVFDEKGLFEKYEFTDVKINPTIKDLEFTATYAHYNFN